MRKGTPSLFMVLKDFLAYRKNLLHVYYHKSSGTIDEGTALI